MVPVYDVTYNLTQEFPLGDTLNTSLANGENRISSNVGILSYVNGTDIFTLEYHGMIGSNVSNGEILTLTAHLQYATNPASSQEYFQTFQFPEIYIIEPILQEATFQFQSLVFGENETEIGSWILSVKGIEGPPNNLVVEIEMNQDLLALMSVNIISIG